MNILEELNEKLRETCCMGDVESAYRCLSQGADVNAKNKMNGWTSLHWASKRGHTTLVEILLKANADTSMVNNKKETAYDLANSQSVRDILSRHGGFTFKPISGATQSTAVETSTSAVNDSSVKFVPNYLSNPAFPYGGQSKSSPFQSYLQPTTNCTSQRTAECIDDGELVLKLRIAESIEKDFIEVELDKKELTFANLVKTCKEELDIEEGREIRKVRKLPNTLVRKDKDVKRLKQFQEIECVL